MEYEIVDKIHSDTIEMDDYDYEIIDQKVHISSSSPILLPSSSSSSSKITLFSLSSSYSWILLIIILFLILYIIKVIINKNRIKQFKDKFTSECSLLTIDIELGKLEKELENESLSETFIIKLEIITNYIIKNDNDDDIKRYGEYIVRIDKIIQTVTLKQKWVSIPTFMNYIYIVIMTNNLIELDKYITKFNILPLLENKTFKTNLSNARDIYAKMKYTNNTENLKNKSIQDLKSAYLKDNADVIREILGFAIAFNLDKEYNEEYNNAEIALQDLEREEIKQMMKDKQQCLKDHISSVNFGAEQIKNKLIESSNTLICDMIQNDDIMLLEMSTSPNQTGSMSSNDSVDGRRTIYTGGGINNDNNDNDTINTIDNSSEEYALINNVNKSSSEQLVLFNNETNTAMLSLPSNNNTLVLVDKSGGIVSNPNTKQQFALTINKIDTDIINLNKETGLEIVKAVNGYNNSISDISRNLESEWGKSRDRARVRAEKKKSDAESEDKNSNRELDQNKIMNDKLDLYNNNDISNENTYKCHQKWKTIQQQWDAVFYVLTLTISFCFFIKTSSSDTVINWFSLLSKSLCKEIRDIHTRNENLIAESCNENNTCINDVSSVWWTYDPFRPLSYVLGIIIYNVFLLLAYFRLSLSSMDYFKCFMNLLTRLMTPMLVSFLVYKYSRLVQLSKYILVIGSCICLYTPIIRFFWPFRQYSYLLLGHTIFHFVILALEWSLTWRLSFLKRTIDTRWICVYILYPIVVSLISAYLGCKHFSENLRKQELSMGYTSIDQEDFFSLLECVFYKLFAY